MKYSRIILAFFFALVFLNCANNKEFSRAKEDCIENLIFKKEFSKNLLILDSYYDKKLKSINIASDKSITFQDKMDRIDKIKSDYYKALSFFSKYLKINYQYKGNYTSEIPYNIYIDEKKIWIDWYEKNKCNNLQFVNNDKD
jgi:hypothetical protein